MKSLIAALVVASITIVPSLSFAQQTHELTRAGVQSQLGCAGQQAPIRQSKNYYPAPARMSGTACDASGYGAPVTGNFQAGAPLSQPSGQTLFAHH
ncbi:MULTISPECIES: hypothetical protein [Paraburkholderia]|uniref:hypothetical protein n=1 Tax=Paraburkholderia TaxID=1822464 RepID=UPI00035D37C7|nr:MULTISPECIES: hypothetical protein [Paraburkholderia]MDH6153665.1 hypothetical protein [Paraburkholderia sp. WSM4179]